jgi:4-hydroxyphenylacetate 3-monooxygenase/4-hydroxybutyryl-CoA dehydratase/vinylacetyl-CoA-Delta-isomerase
VRTSAEYREKLKSMRPNVYVGGRVIPRDDPIVRPGVNTIAYTFDAAGDPGLEPLVTAFSPIIDQKVNRFTHLHGSVDDLLAKVDMTRELCRRVGGCIQRCMGVDALNAIGVVSKEIDEARGTDYHLRFLDYVRYFQKNDLVGNAAQTDAKGDRSKRPHEQADPDLYLRVIEKRRDGIVVRGCKCHNTTGPYADEILVLPTRTLTSEEGDWAVAFAIPADTKGVKLICRATAPRPRKKLQAPYCDYGIVDSFTVFDDVFVPWERVFMCGEWEFAGRLALLFANYHRHSYCGCKPAVTDIIIGATALVAEFNGVGNAPHIREDLAHLMALAELVYAAGVASSVKGRHSSSGIYEPAFIYSNVGRCLAGENVYHEYNVLAATAGGLPATLPFEDDWLNPETAPYLEKYVMRKPGISPEDQHRLFRFISDFSCSALSGVWQYAGVHGGGSSVMERIAIRGQYDLRSRIDLVKYLAGIAAEPPPASRQP